MCVSPDLGLIIIHASSHLSLFFVASFFVGDALDLQHYGAEPTSQAVPSLLPTPLVLLTPVPKLLFLHMLCIRPVPTTSAKSLST